MPVQADELPAMFAGDLTTGLCTWSPAMYEIYGYGEWGRPKPSMALLREHTHPADLPVLDGLGTGAGAAGPGSPYRGIATRLSGVVIDLTASRRGASLTSYDIAAAQAEEITGLTAAIQARDVIGQAKGILMATHQVTAEQAFALLSQISQHTNTKLAEVAGQITRTGQIPPGVLA